MLMRSSKILTLAVAFAILASVVMPIFGVGPVANAAASTEVKIGLLNPSTGPIAVYSDAFTDAAQIAIDDLNTENTDYTFSLVEADSGCDGTKAATAAQTLVDAGVVGIAGAACSGATLGAMAVASGAATPMVSYASTSPAVSAASDDGYLFRVVPSDAQQGMAMATMAAAHGWQNPGIMYMTNDYGAGLAAVVKGAYSAGGVEMCVDIAYADTTTDFST
ncbi:MAG: ABC transporter substrate-binding protein, partial [Candidatus Thermoplasmatota archaeon]|nr:ABC transporter substrate-binding protein [Candidatus Thermoplasmatota archaeon]